MPASADFVEDVLNIVESHTLERHKYETKFPTLESKQPVVETAALGFTEKSYLYRLGSTTIPRSPRDTTQHSLYWKTRAERTADEISSGDATIDSQRETYRKIINTNPHLSRSAATLFDNRTSAGYLDDTFAKRNFVKNFSQVVKRNKVIKGGVNLAKIKHTLYLFLSAAGRTRKH